MNTTKVATRKLLPAARTKLRRNQSGAPAGIEKPALGLSEGQVLQRLGPNGANADVGLHLPNSGFVFAEIFHKSGVLEGWNKRRVAKVVRRGITIARLRGIPAGGPYGLRLFDARGTTMLKVDSFYVGDVWLLGGQSNMQGCGYIVSAAKPHPLVRTFSMRREWRIAQDPMHIRPESPDACHNGGRQCSPEEGEILRKITVRGAGAGLFFAKEMLKRSGVPQGLIAAAHGGTCMDQWSPSRKKEGGNSLYASMVASVKATGQPVAGLLWHQGESDSLTDRAARYTGNMVKLVAAIRRDLRQAHLPVIAAQIGRVHRMVTIDQEMGWKSIQEQQRLLPGHIRNLEVVSGIDLVMDDPIHIGGAGHARLARRMARCADYLVHGNRNEQRPPQFKGLSIPKMREGEFSAIDVHFENIVGKLRAGSLPSGFAICDFDGRNQNFIFKTTLLGSKVRLHVPYPPPLGSFLWHGREAAAYCNVTDERDHALPVFGPVCINKPMALLPFLVHWRITDILNPKEPFALAKAPRKELFGTQYKEYQKDGFINEHLSWIGKSGQCYFSTCIQLPEPMKLQFFMGYDGPFRIWIDRDLLFQDLNGTNPCFPDQSSKIISLSAGRHEICVGMDLKAGASWGFFLRLARRDVQAGQLCEGDFARPLIAQIP